MTGPTSDTATDAPSDTAIPSTPAAPGLTDQDLFYLLGEVSWLMNRSPRYRHVFMADLDWQVMPPIVLQQMRMFRKPADPETPARPGTPVLFVTWALVSDSVAERLRSGTGRLKPTEWRCGPHPWIIDMVAPFGGEAEILAQLRRDVFGGASVPVVGLATGAGPGEASAE